MTKAERRQALDDVIINLAELTKWAINARKDESKLNLNIDEAQELIRKGAYLGIGILKATNHIAE